MRMKYFFGYRCGHIECVSTIDIKGNTRFIHRKLQYDDRGNKNLKNITYVTYVKKVSYEKAFEDMVIRGDIYGKWDNYLRFCADEKRIPIDDALEATFCITQEKEYEDAIEVEFWRRACCENINNGRRQINGR